MKKNILPFIILILTLLNSCGDDIAEAKFYEFDIRNDLPSATVKIIPLTLGKSEFWLTRTDTLIIIPGETIKIGSQMRYNQDLGATDFIRPTEKIASFNVVIDTLITHIDLTQRVHWSFITGPVEEKGNYLLVINHSLLNPVKQ
jgi:hypothetical protein